MHGRRSQWGECADFLMMPVAMEARTSDGLLSLVLVGEATSASAHWGVEGSFSMHTEAPYACSGIRSRPDS